MSDASSLITARLKASVALTAVVASRIYLFVAPPKTTFPLVTMEMISDAPVNDKDGYDRRVQVWQINTFSRRKSDCNASGAAIEAALLATGSDLVAYLLSSLPDYERDTKLHWLRQEFSIWF